MTVSRRFKSGKSFQCDDSPWYRVYSPRPEANKILTSEADHFDRCSALTKYAQHQIMMNRPSTYPPTPIQRNTPDTHKKIDLERKLNKAFVSCRPLSRFTDS